MTHKSWLITAPSIGMILLFIAWSGYWYLLQQKSETSIEQYLKNISKTGFSLTCSQKSYGGYPFRIQLECKNPVLKIKKEKTEIDIEADQLKLLAQAYKLRHVIAEIDGKISMNITQHSKVNTIPATSTKITLANKQMRASLILSTISKLNDGPKNIETFSLVAHDVQSNVLHQTSWGQKIPVNVKTKKAGLHLRNPRPPGEKGLDTDLALEFVDIEVKGDFYTPLDGNSFSAKRIILNSLIRPFYSALIGSDSFAQNWHNIGGVAEIDALYVERTDFIARGEGVLSLDKNGQISGSLDAKFQGFENILNKLIAKNIMTRNQASLANTGLELLSKSSEDEEKQNILTIPMNFSNGQVYFGPHSLGFSPSFF